ncbi:MAG: hypothetical protein R3313_03925 [Candidatus Saccharimonadales bacterium]|nr:hypothetical protein [Candidatus Saccharimonadales bacterium]
MYISYGLRGTTESLFFFQQANGFDSRVPRPDRPPFEWQKEAKPFGLGGELIEAPVALTTALAELVSAGWRILKQSSRHFVVNATRFINHHPRPTSNFNILASASNSISGRSEKC